MDFRVKTLYDSGTAKILEDRLVFHPPFFGVLDGVSGLYDPAVGPRLFGGKSGGQKAVEIVDEVFTQANDSDELIAVVKKANARLREFSESQGIDMNRADLLPGMAFAFVKIGEDGIQILQGGDCYAVWEKTNGEIGATSNQNILNEEECINIINNIIKKYHGDRNRAWLEYMPISAKLRIERVNKNLDKKAVVLNGQSGAENSWYKTTLPLKELKTLLLFTDGMIEFAESRNADEMGKVILGAYHRQGLVGMLSRIREIESKRTHMTHIAQAEATALAIEFKTI
ncbi:MAG: hypothetical protein HYY86_00720 [Candidatus Harrisonbacteria bacterium]|nr:hypothetical protein [Candidatus Harrisonbacteria bacterium]